MPTPQQHNHTYEYYVLHVLRPSFTKPPNQSQAPSQHHTYEYYVLHILRPSFAKPPTNANPPANTTIHTNIMYYMYCVPLLQNLVQPTTQPKHHLLRN